MKKFSEYKRYKDGMWIPHLKRTYLYWFKFLQSAQKNDEFTVDWSKYNGWGGSNYIMGVKFDEFWEEKWKTLFGVMKQGDKPKFPLSTPSPKNESIRLCWLTWKYRNTPIGKRTLTKNKTITLESTSDGTVLTERNIKRRSNSLDIAEKILKVEKRSATFNTIYTWDLSDDRNPNSEKDVMNLVNRYKLRTKKIMSNVCVGMFP